MLMPISFAVDSNQAPTKGSVIYGKAYLVQNYIEEAFSSFSTRSYGSELQVVVVTTATNPGESLQGGIIGAIGYGEGLSAADRYLIEGRPCEIISSKPELVNTSPIPFEPAPYVEGEENPLTVSCICP
jgi:hypothetical protein